LDGGNRFREITIPQAIAALKQMDVVRLPVVGNSMTPMLMDRDILMIEVAPPSELARGDIIVRGKHELITHRVVAIRRNRVYTKGDARYWIDPMTEVVDILGKVKQIERNGLVVDMESAPWRIVNRVIGGIGWIQVYLVWSEQTAGKNKTGKTGLHRISFWISKKLNWVILLLFTGRWLFHRPLRMDEKC
jgi:signal peptidase I